MINRLSIWNTTNMKVIYYLIGFMLVAVVWGISRVPTLDGPVHINNAYMIHEIFSGRGDLFARFFVLNPYPDPNWFLHFLLSSLMGFLNPWVVEKMVQTAYFLGFSMGLVYAIRGVRRDSWYVAFLGIPLAGNLLFHFGFYSFELSLPVSLFFLGYWLRHRDDRPLAWRSMLALGVLALILYVLHVVSYIATLLAILSWTVVRSFQGANIRREFVSRLRSIVRCNARLAISVLPSFLLFLAFFLPREVIVEPSNSVLVRVAHLMVMSFLVSFDYKELVFTGILGVSVWLFVGSTVVRDFRMSGKLPIDGALAATLSAVFLYLVTPNTLVVTPGGVPGGGLIESRLAFFPYFMVLLWLAGHRWGRRHAASMALVGTMVTLGLLSMHTYQYRLINRVISEYSSAREVIADSSVVLPIRMADMRKGPGGELLSVRVDPLIHASHYLAVGRPVVNLNNIQAMYGYFPVRFRPDHSPLSKLGRLDIVNPDVDIAGYERQIGRQIDYVTLWGDQVFSGDREGDRRIVRQLESGYRLVFRSEHGSMRVFERRRSVTAVNRVAR